MRKIIFLTIILIFVVNVFGQKSYRAEIENWRTQHESELRQDDSWFSLAGLFWLKDGTNSIGRGDQFDIRLTDNFSGLKFGEIDFQKGVAKLTIEPGVVAEIDGRAVTSVVLNSDISPKPMMVRTGSETFYLIKREDRFGIRLKDKNNPNLLNFKGLHWFSVNQNFRIVATFIPFAQPKEVLIPNQLGGSYKMKSEGLLQFKLGGKKLSLQPVEEDGKFFIIFRDLTSRSETYGMGRFLYAEKSADNKIILDFNKAENPPCAYTTFATCPIPPPQNRLNISISAGEKRYH